MTIKPTINVDSLETWINRAGNVRCTPEQRKSIAVMCLKAQEYGEVPNNVWHQTSKYFGYEDRCNCVPCSVKDFKINKTT